MAAAWRTADMPLFPSEADIARAVLGPGRAQEWRCLAPSLERQGMPRVDPVFGGRYWPAVRAWMDRRAGLSTMTVRAQPDGEENFR